MGSVRWSLSEPISRAEKLQTVPQGKRLPAAFRQLYALVKVELAALASTSQNRRAFRAEATESPAVLL
jgi:hypothetical protein